MGATLSTQYQALQPSQMTSRNVWQPQNAPRSIEQMETSMLWHSILVWVVLPLCIGLQVLIPALAPSCGSGYTNWSLLFMLLVELHHLWAERRAWSGMRDLISPPEASVLRQLGVLASRRRCVLLGILEDLDLYTDLAFPFIALACDDEHVITNLWSDAWDKVPVLGHLMSQIILTLRFFGVALIAVGLNVVVSGITKIFIMMAAALTHRDSMKLWEAQQWRIPTEAFFSWAQAAECAMMPSVAVLSEEMAAGQRYRYRPNADSATTTKMREDYEHGKVTEEALMTSGIHDTAEEDKIQAAERRHFNLILFQKVFLGNVLALWLQSSFLALTFQDGYSPAQIKLIISMIFSGLQAAVRCCHVSSQTGLAGLCVSILVMFFVAWSFLKVYEAYHCKYHLWNLTTGCGRTLLHHHDQARSYRAEKSVLQIGGG